MSLPRPWDEGQRIKADESPHSRHMVTVPREESSVRVHVCVLTQMP